ncbi:MAG: restriction endonuclease [Rickettsiales bacterium]|nr:restriction endonuclease [Rickettsiales bacterium]
MKVVPFEDLNQSDLVIDGIYESTHDGQLSREALNALLPGIGNQGGFRPAGNGLDKNLVVLYSTGESRDWPDTLDTISGQFIYYGDNKKPGHELHDTRKGGNKILRRVFELLHNSPESRQKIPPFLIFVKSPTANGARSVQFKGLAVPGYPGMPATEDLVAVWKTSDNKRFQNYKAYFTVLDIPVISRAWLKDIFAGNTNSDNAPKVWMNWVNTNHYQALVSEPTTIIRNNSEQMPETPLKREILEAVWTHFHHENEGQKRQRAFLFEHFAARIFQMHDRRVMVDEITRGVGDGGRDAIGRYLLGLGSDPIYVEFSLEAKCYDPGINSGKQNTVGVKETSRLISRIRNRQFGVLVTTSSVHKQAYQEVSEDRHPIIFICGGDIADILISSGLNSKKAVSNFLEMEFPVKEDNEQQ